MQLYTSFKYQVYSSSVDKVPKFGVSNLRVQALVTQTRIDDTLLVELTQGLDHETSSLFALQLDTLLVEVAQGLDHETSLLFALKLDTLLVKVAQGLDHETSLLFALKLDTLLVKVAQGLDHKTSLLFALNWTQNQNLEQKYS